jgi:hypothetical protein
LLWHRHLPLLHRLPPLLRRRAHLLRAVPLGLAWAVVCRAVPECAAGSKATAVRVTSTAPEAGRIVGAVEASMAALVGSAAA